MFAASLYPLLLLNHGTYYVLCVVLSIAFTEVYFWQKLTYAPSSYCLVSCVRQTEANLTSTKLCKRPYLQLGNKDRKKS